MSGTMALRPEGGWRDSLRGVVWLLVLLPATALAIRHWSDGPPADAADYAQYLGHARALAQSRPFTDTGYIFTTLYPNAGPAAQPPGLPLLLWGIFGLVGQNMLVVKLVLLAAALAFYVLAGRYFAAGSGLRLGLAVALLLGLSPGMARFSTVVNSDLLFCALVWGMIHLYDRDGPFTAVRVALITVLGAGALLVRTLGVALAPAALLFTLLQYRRHGLRPAFPAAVWTAAFLVVNAVLPITYGLIPGVGAMLTRALHTISAYVWAYRFALFNAHLYPFPRDIADDAYHVVAALAMLAGLAVWCRRAYRSFAVAFAVTYGAMLLVVPVLEHRYMWPVFPLLVFGLVNGVALAARLIPRVAAASAPIGLAFALVLSALAFAFDSAQPVEPSFAGRTEVRDVFRELERIAAQGPIRVAFVRPQVLALETGISSMSIFPAPPRLVLEELDRKCISHVVLGDLGLAPEADSAFREAARLNPDRFLTAYANGSFAVLRYVGPACARRDPRGAGALP